MVQTEPFHVAIVGGGVCGIALGIALQKRKIPFTLFESRASFTEIGAGINLGPSALRALRLIDPSLGEKVLQLATRNPPPKENIWMTFRYGAAQGSHGDGEIVHEISSPPTGNMTLHRQELLALLAAEMGTGHTQFNKKLSSYSQTSSQVTLHFTDNTTVTSSLLIACDGIHSKVRSTMFSSPSTAHLSKPTWSHTGLYRALIPMSTALSVLGDSARSSTITLGPQSYIISYPVSSGTQLNCGAWASRPSSQSWPDDEEWILPHQSENFKRDFRNFGPRAQKILALFDPDPSLWATFHHTHQPPSFIDGLVYLIGDSAHSMPPHQGAGASTAIEDAYLLSEVLAHLTTLPSYSSCPSALAIHLRLALTATEQVRLPRVQEVHRFSHEAGGRNFSFFEQELEGEELAAWIAETERRLNWIWQGDLKAHADEAKGILEGKLSELHEQERQGELK